MLATGTMTAPPYANSERRNGEISETMYTSGDLLVPRLGGHPHLTKPPLFHWFSYAVSSIRGEGGLASARIAAIGGALAALLMTYLLGRRMFGHAQGWYGALLLLTCVPLFLHHGHRGTFDTTLAAFLCMVLYGYASLDGPHPLRGKIILILGLVGGFMVKGPVAWIFPAVPCLLDSVQRRGGKRTATGTLLIALVVLALSLPWYVILILRVPEAKEVFIDAVRVNFGGNADSYSMAFHREPFFFYLWMLPVLMMPWTLFLEAFRPSYVRQHGPESNYSGVILAQYVIWSVLFLTLVPAKADRYLVPLAPAVCLLVGRWLGDHRLAVPGSLAWLNRLWYVLFGIFAVAVVGLPFWLWARIGEPVGFAVCIAGILAMATVFVWHWRKQVSIPLFLATILVALLLVVPFAYKSWIPRSNYLHQVKDSPERQAYKQRMASLRQLFGKSE